MGWPFPKKAEEPQMPTEPEVKTTETKPNEKSVAEIISESLQPFAQRFDKLQQDIDEIRKPKEPVRKVEPTERVSVLDDEDAAFNQRMTPILQSQLELETRMSVRDVKQEYIDAGLGSIWLAQEKEINDTINGSPLVQPDGNGGVKKLRSDPQYIRNVADMVIGRAARTAGVRFDGQKKTFFLESANSNENSGGPRASETDGLTAKQIAFAKVAGIPLDKYKATAAKLDFQH